MKKVVFLFLLFTCVGATAQSNDSRWFRLTLGFFVNSQQIHRGAVFYPAPTTFAGPAFTFFNQINVRGPDISWSRSKRSDKFQYQIGLRFINDGAPFLGFSSSFDEDTDYRASRKDSLEAYLGVRYRFGFKDLFEWGVELSKDLNSHEGNYALLSLKLPALIKFLSLTIRSGVGSLEHNRYVYGTNAVSGLAHQDLELSYVIPQLPWSGIIIFSLSQSWVMQKENINANLIRGHHDQLVASTRWLWFF
jgi:hypothetical protein